MWVTEPLSRLSDVKRRPPLGTAGAWMETMRFVFVASVVSFVIAAATFACSSSDPAAASADAGKDAKSSTPVDTTGDDDDTTTGPNDAAPTGNDAGATDASEGGSSSGGPLTTAGDGGAACAADSLREAEPNNDEASANKLPDGKTFTFCGTANSTDTDVFTFVTPDFNNSFGVTPSGDNVKYKIQIGDKTFDGLPPGGFGTINIGDKWIITVSTGSATTRSYALKIEFE